MKNKPDVSIVIVNYNAEKFLRETLKSIEMQKGVSVETIVVDNNSTDGSKAMVSQEFKDVAWVQRDTSRGFSAGNNLGIKYAHGEAILFMNPDACFVKEDDLKLCLAKLHSDKRIGALTPRVNLALTGGIDETCHRGFPTPWAGFTHFSLLFRLFPHVPFFNQYTKNYLGYNTSHEIDAVGGMFMLMRRSVGEAVGWWDEDYDFYGEDLDLCYRLVQAGYHNLYYSEVVVTHYKGVTTGMSKHSRTVSSALDTTTRQVKAWSVRAMEIFYTKHYAAKYPFFINWIVFLGIKLLKLHRLNSS